MEMKAGIGGFVGNLLLLMGIFGSFLVLFVFRPDTHPASWRVNHATYQVDGPRVAICIVGEPRAFELTGPSIRRHVLAAYNNSDVFFNIALTDKIHKLALLSGLRNLVVLRVFPQVPLEETEALKSVLTDEGSPGGYQGLLLYFQMVESCWDLIRAHQRRSGQQYDWVLRVRADSYWNGPPPLLEELDPTSYTVPYGQNYAGLNDRAGIGGAKYSQVAFQRRSSIPSIVGKVSRGNSERAYAARMAVANVSISAHDFNFCILTPRRTLTPMLTWPLYGGEMPLVSIRSQGPLNGVYCRPCTTVIEGPEALEFYKNLTVGFGSHAFPQFCNGLQEPEYEGWEAEFDEVAGPEGAGIRRDVSNRTFIDCVGSYMLLERSPGYVGPPAEVACQLSGWGRVEIVGNWPIYLKPLTDGGIVYSVLGSGELQFEETIAGMEKCELHLFDGVLNLAEKWGPRPSVRTHAWFLGAQSSEMSSLSSTQKIKSETVLTSMATLGHIHLDVLKIFGLDVSKGIDIKQWEEYSRVICQVLIEFDQTFAHENTVRWVNQLGKCGFTLITCKGVFGIEKCLFITRFGCKPS